MQHYHILMTRGFSVTELVAFIAIIAVVVAIAIPKFINLSTTNQTTAISAISNALSAANKNNYTVRKMDGKLGKTVKDCADVGKVLQGGLPAGYVIKSNYVQAHSTESCIITGPSSTTGTFKATGII